MSQPTAFITGATGHQGGATARELLKSGVKVHALVRDPSSKPAADLQRLGAHLFRGDFDNLSSLKAALDGATAVFLNVSPIPSDPAREVHQAKNIIDAAVACGTVTTIVYSSVTMTGSHEAFPNWGPAYPLAWYWENKARIEAMVRASGVESWTILRPAFMMHNYHLPTASLMFPELVQRRAFQTAYKPTTAMTVVDAGDVGKFAAAAIVGPSAFKAQVIDLGVESLTPAEIVRELSRVSGKDVSLQFYGEKEAEELAVRDLRIWSQLWANEVGYQVNFRDLDRYPIRLTRFAEYLEKHREQVLQTFS
ncbi:NmrA/HSCARG family protein [Aspergillus mulundensis]|uniref:NAD dependent epimerase n=1 Tax=Aspergillus mulundensis TaxID=1810919 RepID=A0A3D8QMX4_9EURO|nr:NAD dependent epimerase [Aspergillus mulundensis]RDW63048.1 NAD dependent epimerase [Aspergillus mulundensis]